MPEIFNSSANQELNPAPIQEKAHSSKVEKKPPAKRCIDDYSEVMRVEHPTINPVSAFAPKPENVAFTSQQHGEEIVLLLRQHPVTQVRWVLTAIGLTVFPLIFALIPFFDFFPVKYQTAGLIGWYLLVMGFILQSFLNWFFNVYIITDERVIDVDFYNLIHRNVSSAKIDNVEDVTTVTGGTLQSIFDYGTVIIQTAGSQQLIEFEFVPQPAKVTKLLNEMILEEEREKLEGRVS